MSEFPSKWRCGLSGWPQAKAAPAAPTAETAEAERGAQADTSVARSTDARVRLRAGVAA